MCGECEWISEIVSQPPQEAAEAIEADGRLELPPARLLTSSLQSAIRAYNSSGVDFVIDHFATYLSLIINGSKLEWSLVNKGFEYIERTCQQLCTKLEELFRDKELNGEVRTHSLNCLKVSLYIFCELMKVKDTKLAAQMAATLTIGKRKKAAADQDQFAECEWRESERRTALDVIYNLLQLSLHRLWDPPLADDAFVDMVAQPCYRIMEDPIIKNKTTRETVFQILGILNKKYNHGLSCTIKLVQIVQLYEHAVSPVCAGICQLVTSWSLTGLVARLVRELGEALGDSGGTGEEGAGAGAGDAAQRHCAQFLTELTQLMPSHMIPAAQAMRSYLEIDECYPLRTSVLGMLCEILCRELKGEGLSEENRLMRDDFLDDLTDHIHDSSAYVRSRVLQYWARLQREGCVPITRQQTVLARAVGRLQDKATIVRKNAIQLVKVFLEHNPYSAELKLANLEKQLIIEKEKLEAIQQQLNMGTDSELLKKWDEIYDEIKEALEKNLSQPSQDELTNSQRSVLDSYVTIKNCIMEAKYDEAFLIVRETEKQHPQARMLRCEMDKKDQVGYFLALLQNVFTTDTKKMELANMDDENLLIKKLEEKENIVAFLEDSISFSKLIQQAIPLVYTLLMSKQSTDVNEAIDFFITAHNFNIETAKLGIMGMLQLVWSPDQEKRDAVDNAYKQIYLKTEGSERTQAVATAAALIKLASSINRGQAAAFQVLLGRWLKSDHLNNSVLQVLWETFTLKHDKTTDNDSYAALSLLVMVSKSKPSVASANIEVIQNVGLTSTYRKKVLCLQLLLSISQTQQRFPMDNQLLKILSSCFVEAFFKSKHFAAFGTSAINVIYALCDTPDLMCIEILSTITEKINQLVKVNDEGNSTSYSVEYVSRLIVILGHIALQQLIYLDVTVYSELRRRNEIRDQRKADGVKNKINIAGKKQKEGDVSFNSSSASAAGRMHRLHNQSTSTTVQGEEPDDLEEACLEGAVADDADAELVRTVCDRDIVCGGLLGQAASIIHNILQGPILLKNAELRAAACLALGRFMLVSPTFCEDNMQLLMSLLKNSSCSVLRCNIIITLSDLTLRFPNIIQPWTTYIYERLEDSSVEVRQCTVKMLSYLILQEMVRVRGQVSGLAKCCVDADSNTRTMARLFFKQLSQKGNSLYNIIPDIISRLSDPSIRVPEDDFRMILKYIMSLIQKDRQMEALVEKLCLRFKLSTDERQWRDLAFCLSLFSYNDRSVKKLIENMDCYKDKLFSKEVYNSFKLIITNTNKLAKADLKATVAELSDKIEEIFTIRESNDDKTNDEAPRFKHPATPRPRKGAAGRRNRPQKSSSGSEDSDNDIENVTPVKNGNHLPNGGRSSARKRVPLRYQDNNSEDSDEEEFVQKKTNKRDDVFKKPVGRVGRKRK